MMLAGNEGGENNGFAVGDVVVLRSGGPHMTVCDFDLSERVIVEWFPDDSSPSPVTATFKAEVLEKVK